MFYIQIAILASLVSFIPEINQEDRVYVSYNNPKLKHAKTPIQSRCIKGPPQIRNHIKETRG